MNDRTFAHRVIDFYADVALPGKLPDGVVALNPYKDGAVQSAVSAFYTKYFNDTDNRVFLIGINPGRFGAGTTGIAFTDTPALKICGIDNSVKETKELSADFVYQLIARCGGPAAFYQKCFITSFCPIGFIRDGRNFNYYDNAAFLKAIRPYILRTFKQQLQFGAKRTALVMGKDKNYKALAEMNRKHSFFDKIIPLEHPRFIMQYRRKRVDDYLMLYQTALLEAE